MEKRMMPEYDSDDVRVWIVKGKTYIRLKVNNILYEAKEVNFDED